MMIDEQMMTNLTSANLWKIAVAGVDATALRLDEGATVSY